MNRTARLAAAALCAATITAAAACSSTRGGENTSGTRGGSATQVTLPPTAGDIATMLGATGYTDSGSAPLGGVTDFGLATIKVNGKPVKIVVDTFPGAAQLTRWRSAAADLGYVVVDYGTMDGIAWAESLDSGAAS